jgi:hypothetical protein
MSRNNTRDIRVIVRKVASGIAPYGWEIYDAGTCIPCYVCLDRFRSMETAFKAGQAWLATCVSASRRRVREADDTMV